MRHWGSVKVSEPVCIYDLERGDVPKLLVRPVNAEGTGSERKQADSLDGRIR